MTSSRSDRTSRQRDGTRMVRLREAIDPDTGEVYHVETTRQAKRRHQRSGGAQYKPTLAQINAADIWNKQEEKIKKDKEREEKRKKNKIKQDVKDARQKEVQQTMLREGKITIEDTWGKVNASQNRIHRFFGAPQTSKASASKDTDQKSVSSHDEFSDFDTADEESADESTDKAEENAQLQDINTKDTASTVTALDETIKSLDADAARGEDTLVPGRTRSALKRCLSASQTIMPPPALPIISSVAPQEIQHAMASSRRSQPILSEAGPGVSPPRLPLGEMTMSEVNIRANEKPDPLIAEAEEITKCFPVATQVVRDTLSGLCSQDFNDDLDEDTDNEKENNSPLSSLKSQGSRLDKSVSLSPKKLFQEELDHYQDAKATCEPDVHEEINSELDYFGDDDINDEILISLAATQQLEAEFSQSSSFRQPIRSPLSEKHPTSITSAETHSPPQSRPALASLPTAPAQAGDSFAMDGLNDADLLEGLEDYEHDTEGLDDDDLVRCVEGMEKSNHQPRDIYRSDPESPVRKKRRVLPWVRNPIPEADAAFDEDAGEGRRDALTPSLGSFCD